MVGLENWQIATPEMILAAGAMVLLMIGAFRGEKSVDLVAWLSVAVLIGAAVAVIFGTTGTAFAGLFLNTPFTMAMKVLSLLGSALAILMSASFMRREGAWRFEYPVIIVLATLGMMIMLSSADLMTLYVGLEMQSLALYVVAAFQRDNARSTEAGVKYFVLGAVASCMMLYGSSLVYGFAGTTNFAAIAKVFAAGAPPLGAVIGLVFILAGLVFKVSAVPFHMWTPDVYEGAPTPVTALFSVAPKIAALGLLVAIVMGPFRPLMAQSQQILIMVSVASMAWGAFAAIRQENIKRLMAYSSIGNMGYALLGLAAGTEEGIRAVVIYMIIYLAMSVGTFACILSMRRGGVSVERIADLAGLWRNHPRMALALLFFMFSMAGIPPLAGFFGKLNVFLAAINAGLFWASALGVAASVVAAYYYLRIIKVMFLDDPAAPFDAVEAPMGAVMAVMAVFVFPVFLVFQWPFLASAQAAAHAFFVR